MIHTSYSQNGCCSAQHQQWDMIAHVYWFKEFLSVPMLESSKLSIWPESSLRVGVPHTWPTGQFLFLRSRAGPSVCPRSGISQKKAQLFSLGSPSAFLFIYIVSHLCWPFLLSLSLRSLLPRPCIEWDKEWQSRVQRAGWQDHCLWTFEPGLWER